MMSEGKTKWLLQCHETVLSILMKVTLTFPKFNDYHIVAIRLIKANKEK